MTCLYELLDISQVYAGKVVLDIPELRIEKGKIVGITGPNGSGKSTLLRILAFLEKPATGTLRFKGIPVAEPTGEHRRLATMLLQESRLLKRSVFDNVAFGLKARRQRERIPSRVFEALEMVGLDPSDFASRSWFELSGGESQRVALASRLILNPEVLVLDEPTASVDSQSSTIIRSVILETREKLGTTVITVSHDLDWAYGASDEVISMFSGKILSRGPENIIHGPWTRSEDGTLLKKLDDGQIITASSFPGSSKTGALDPEDIIISTGTTEKISARNAIKGTVTRMNLENGSNRVLVTMAAGGQVFSARITSGSLGKLGFLPGSEVTIIFKATAIKWI
ncbi:MAG TPA: ATP-binding cassette domain-containing protein [Synergistetes bacterium]|nr:ATP-binding cassette domain-containing protein [Synergistota bacterium]